VQDLDCTPSLGADQAPPAAPITVTVNLSSHRSADPTGNVDVRPLPLRVLRIHVHSCFDVA
jgi:hypothetical protein